MTDTLIAISEVSSSDRLQRLAGFTSTLAASALDLTAVSPSQLQTQLEGCTWDRDGNVVFNGRVPGGYLVRLSGYTTTRLAELVYDTSGFSSHGVCVREDDPISTVWYEIAELAGWTTTRRKTINVHQGTYDFPQGVEWDGDDLYAASTHEQEGQYGHSYLTRYRTFSTTIEHRFDAVNVDNLNVGISRDGLDTIVAGYTTDKLYKYVAFSSTLKGSSVDISSLSGRVVDLSHMSYAERTAQQTPPDHPGTIWCGDQDQAGAGGSLYTVGGFSSTILATIRLASSTSPTDVSYDGTNAYTSGFRNTNEPVLRKHDGISSTDGAPAVPTSGLGETNPQGISWGGPYVYFCGKSSDKLYRLVGFSGTVASSVSCPPGHLEPDAACWTGTHVLWSSSQSNLFIKSSGFSSTLNETIAQPLQDVISATGASFDGIDYLMADRNNGSGSISQLKKLAGFTTTIKDITYVASIDNRPMGLDHMNPTARIAPGYAITVRSRVGRMTCNQRSRNPVRIGRELLPGTAITPGPRPPFLRFFSGTKRTRAPRRPIRFSRRLHTSAAPLPAPPELGDIIWVDANSTMGCDIGSTAVNRSTLDIASLVGSSTVAGLSYDGTDVYLAATDATVGAIPQPRIMRTTGWSAAYRNVLQLPLGAVPRGVCWDGRDVIWADGQARTHVKQDGMSSTVKQSVPLNVPFDTIRGVTWTGAERIWSVDDSLIENYGFVYRSTGFSGTVSGSVSAEIASPFPHGNAMDVTWDGSNLYVCGSADVNYGEVQRRVGWSSTYAETVHSGGVVLGCCVADVRYRLGGPNPVRRSMVVARRGLPRRGRPARLPRPQIHTTPPAGPATYSPAIFHKVNRRGRMQLRPARTVRVGPRLVDFARRYFMGRGKYRVFNAAVYRFYRSNSGPPKEADAPFATSASLPSTPANTYADGTWWISVSYFNGVVDSGFLPLGPNGETYIRLDISGGVVADSPPQPPGDWRLEVRAGGVVRILAFYLEVGVNRATSWGITYTTDGSTPPVSPPGEADVFVPMPSAGLAVLSYDLPAQANGTTVKVRLQTTRGGVAYSEGSTVKIAIVDSTGPTAALVGQRWPGRLPERL